MCFIHEIGDNMPGQNRFEMSSINLGCMYYPAGYLKKLIVKRESAEFRRITSKANVFRRWRNEREAHPNYVK